ncbi:MBG domain-containing protein, partial [Chitinophaga sancti]
FVNSETAGVLTGTLSYSGNSQGAVNVGNYVISPSGLSALNYSITYVDGNLNIGKAVLTVTAIGDSKTYDGMSYTGGNGVSYSGFVNSENAGVLTGALTYSGSSQGAANAGSYVISPSGLSAANYAITYVDGSLSIGKAALTVTADNDSKIYDGVVYSGGNGVSYSGFVNSENAGVLTGTLTYSGSSQGAVNAGNYVISPSGLSAANYTITYVAGSLNIGKTTLTVTAIDDSKTYDGVSYSGGNGVSYSGFVNSENAGVLTGTLSYSGNSQGAVNAGNYVISPSGLSALNYTITYVDGNLSIGKAILTVTANNVTKTYDGVSYSGGNGVSYSGFVNSETAGVLTGTLIYNGSSQGAVNVGSYVISPLGLSAVNYTITYVAGSLSIGKAAFTVTADDATKTYDGVGYSGGNGVSYSGFVNSENAGVLTGTLIYSGSSQGAVNVGSYVISPSGLSAANYTITYVDGSLSISKTSLTVTADDATKTYDGVGYSGGNGVSYSGFVNSETAGVLTGTLSYNGSSQGAVNVGTYVISPSGLSAANYSITYVDGSLSIAKAALTVTAIDATKTYDGVSYSGGNGVSYNGFVNSENASVLTGTLTYSGSSQGAMNVGSYVISPSGLSAANYTITYVDGSLNIGKAALTVTANNATKTYDGVIYSGGNGVSYSGFVNSENAGVLTGTLIYGGSSQGAVNVGTYVISPSGLSAANYSITYLDGSLSIGKAALTVTANNATKIYDGVGYSGGNGVSYSGFVNSENAGVLIGTLTYSGSSQGAVNAGSYVITPSGLSAANYTITYVDGGLSIGKAALTVTANNATKTYDGVIYSGGNGVSYSGFVNSENAGVLTGTLIYGGSSQGAVNVGNYVMAVSGLSAANYTITYVDGSLSIGKAALIVKAIDKSKTYDGVSYSGGNGVSFNGFVNGENAGVLTGTLTYSGSSQGAVNVGQYNMIPAGYSSNNYTISYTNGILIIDKAALTITAESKARCVGIVNPTFTISYSGWVNGEGISTLSTAATVSSGATALSPAGTYTIIPAGAVADNYTITYVNGALTIYPLPVVTLTASNGAVLCGNNASITLTASGNYTYQWLQDNSIINGMNTSTITISAIGKYTAMATDGNGCTANADNNITITRLLPATVAFDYDSYCAGKAVSFTNTSDISKSGNVTYTWLSGDGQTSNSKNVRFTYGTAGSYVASLSIAPVACPSLAVTATQQINIAAQVEGVRLPTVTTKTGLATQLTARELVGAEYTWTPATGLSDAGIYNPVATLYESQEYQIEMNFASGCSTIDTLLVSPFVSYDIITPNAFTPNGDGQNDVFKVHLRGIKQFNYLVIYDRWGNKVFESKDASIGWDGSFKGALNGVGTYIWMAAGTDVDGRTIQRQGVVTLIR